jgi:hypothetical protein
MDDSILINETAAHQTASGIADPVVRNLVMFALAEARMRAIRRVGQDEAGWRAGLPEQPFDMDFFAIVASSLFGKTEIVRRILDGQNLAEASDWNV